MADLNQSPALWAVYNVTQAVEALGCGDAFTAAVLKCSDALQAVDAEVQRRIAAETDLATSRAALEDVRRDNARLRKALEDVARHWNDDLPVFEHTHQLYAAATVAQEALAQEAGDAWPS